MKAKISISIDHDLLEKIDKMVEEKANRTEPPIYLCKVTRSLVVNELLRTIFSEYVSS